MEGRFLGLPAIAVSLVLGESKNFAHAALITTRLVRQIVDDPLPKDTILNVNVPDLPPDARLELEVTRLGFRHKSEPVIRSTDPKGEPIYWIGPAGRGQDSGAGTDFHAIENGHASVTPIKVDLTDHARIAPLSEWLRRRI
jgi:5'-nucleotidase